VAFLFVDVPVVHILLPAAAQVLENCGAKVTITYLNPANPDPSAAITKALLDKPDWVMTDVGQSGDPLITRDLVQQGFPQDHVVMGSSVMVQSYFQEFGSEAVGQVFMSETTNLYDNSDPDVQLYKEILAKYNGGQPVNFFKAQAVVELMTIYDGAKAIGFGGLTSASLTKYFQTAPSFHIFMGLTGTNLTHNPNKPGIKAQAVMPVRWTGTKLVTLQTANNGWLYAFGN
jgi:hypothetical protein